MTAKKNYRYVLMLLSLLYFSCKKIDYKLNINRTNCEFVKATAMGNAIYTYPILLLKKEYDAQYRVNRVNAAYRNIAGGIDEPATYRFKYDGKKTSVFDTETGDSIAVLKYNDQGQLIYALTSPYLLGDEFSFSKAHFFFSYGDGKLKKIFIKPLSGSDTSLQTYVKLEYDGTNRNVKTLTFSHLGNIVYDYDYSREANGQFYADEMSGAYFYFWYFVKYLNIFPELQPKNVLMHFYFTVHGYPGDFERTFTNHAFDGAGNLISYHMRERGFHETWTINWNCSSSSIK